MGNRTDSGEASLIVSSIPSSVATARSDLGEASFYCPSGFRGPAGTLSCPARPCWPPSQPVSPASFYCPSDFGGPAGTLPCPARPCWPLSKPVSPTSFYYPSGFGGPAGTLPCPARPCWPPSQPVSPSPVRGTGLKPELRHGWT
jgi:hypothetical protein